MDDVYSHFPGCTNDTINIILTRSSPISNIFVIVTNKVYYFQSNLMIFPILYSKIGKPHYPDTDCVYVTMTLNN